MTKQSLVAGLLSSLIFLPAHVSQAEQPRVAGLMERKLQQSQKLLEGIALSDFNKIGKHADELAAISRQAQWKVLKTPLYQLHSTEFQRSAENLSKNAADKNLDAAALSYVELTLTCVKCHKHVREVRMARLPGE